MEEIWKPISPDIYWQGVKNIYEVSNTGKVRNKITGRILAQRKGQGPQQSPRVTLTGMTYPRLTFNVSRLVYNAFCDPQNKPRDYSVITFVDGNPANCAFNNLIAL